MSSEVAAFKDDPVAAEGHQPTIAADHNTPKLEGAFKDDPVSAGAQNGEAKGALAGAGMTAEDKVNKKEVKVTAEPITSGVLGYKAPGFVSQLRYSKKYFFLGDEPIPVSDLQSYLHSEKGDAAHHNAAWSSQTGKGLLYFTKREEDKKTPSGIINLSEATEVANEGSTDFSFKIKNHRHAFQAQDTDTRNGWVVAIKSAVEEAKANHETITGSDGFKSAHSSVGKGVAAAAAGGAAATATGAAAATESSRKKSPDGTATNDNKAEGLQPKSQSRSVSRSKRGSIFGGLGRKKDPEDEKKKEDEKAKKENEALAADAKKDEKEAEKEEKKAEKAVEKEDKKQEKEAEKVEKHAQKENEAAEKKAENRALASRKSEEKKRSSLVGSGAALAAGVQGDIDAADGKNKKSSEQVPEAATGEEKAKGADTSKTNKSAKRGSIFGNFFHREKATSPAAEKKEEELTPAVPPKDEPTTTSPAHATAPKAEEKDLPTPAAEYTDAKETQTPAAEESSKDAPIAATAGAAAGAGVVGAGAAAATTPSSDANEKRRSFFGLGSGIGSKKEKTEASSPTSDGEKRSSKLGEMFRRPSKAIKSSKKEGLTTKDLLDPKVNIPEEGEQKEGVAGIGYEGTNNHADSGSELPNAATGATGASATKTAANGINGTADAKTNGNAIGDVVPEAVSVGQTTEPAAAA